MAPIKDGGGWIGFLSIRCGELSIQRESSLLVLFCCSGLTEVSFLPAKAILSLEHKAESEKVREQLAILLRSDCVRNLDICNFLSLGMATYFNSSETHKEGRCFVRRHETAEEYFTKRRRQHCSIWVLVLSNCTAQRCPKRVHHCKSECMYCIFIYIYIYTHTYI